MHGLVRQLPTLAWIGLLACSAPPAAAADDVFAVSFRHDVLPILTRAGCNAGTCHGTPTGRNGFRLSLRGYDPALDSDTLTREHEGRRVNVLRPDDSLVLLKASAQVPHEGGRRIRRDSDEYRALRDWIAFGASDDSPTAPAVTRLDVAPPRQTIGSEYGDPDAAGVRATTPVPLRVTASFADGTQRNVTWLTRFSVNDERIATVTGDGVVERRRRGEVTVIAEYAGRFATASVVFRDPAADFVWPDRPMQNEIDRIVQTKLRLLQIEPAPLAADEEFLRRAYLDAIGRLPEPEEVREFVADTDPDRRSRLIDRLLDRPEFADWWALKWIDRLGGNNRFVGLWGAVKYHQWVRHAMAANVPEDEFARAILTADGPNYAAPPAGFWRRLRLGGIGANIDPLLSAEEVSQLFLGVRLQCARCHNHPGERWTQDDFYGLAAFFSRIRFKDGPYVNHQYDKENTIFLADAAPLADPRTGETVAPRVLDGRAMVEAASARGAGALPPDPRKELAAWVTAPDNPYFARTSANRIWYHLFGRGIVEPVDDFRISNPPAHPELLDYLADQLVSYRFDRKHVIRLILNSATYQTSSRTTPTGADDARYFSHYPVRLLQAEQLLDAISQATGVPEAFPGRPPGTRAAQLADGEYKHAFLEAFGRPARAMACECERDPTTNLGQALHLISGRTVQGKLADDSGRAAQLAGSDLTAEQIVDELYLATLSRPPSAAEQRLLAARIPDEKGTRRAAVEDALWTLINLDEFLFQH